MIWLDDSDFTLHQGDALTILAEMPSESVDCVITSPPYWGLRDYGTGAWEGGDGGCDHVVPLGDGGSGPPADGYASPFRAGTQYTHQKVAKDTCGKCGATRSDAQLGLEPTPERYVERMTAVFREVRRVLAAHGTCWVNMGDSYASGELGRHGGRVDGSGYGARHPGPRQQQRLSTGLKPKDLCGIPWRLAFALQADGWYLRSDIVWSKPNPMPESVIDRPTKAHEYVFLLTKSPRYFFDAEAVREPHKEPWRSNGRLERTQMASDRGRRGLEPDGGTMPREYNPSGRNIRSVWEIATQPYPEAHFATFPEELVRRCLLAGCAEQVCGECGKARERVVELDEEYRARLVQRQRPEPLGVWLRAKREAAGLRQGQVAALFPSRTGGQTGCVSNWELDKNIPTPKQWKKLKETLALGDEKDALLDAWHEYERGLWGTTPDPMTHGAPSAAPAMGKNARTLGFTDCGHDAYRPGICLDPFMGSGTTALVARKHGRRSVGIELSAEYCELIVKRTQQLSLLSELT